MTDDRNTLRLTELTDIDFDQDTQLFKITVRIQGTMQIAEHLKPLTIDAHSTAFIDLPFLRMMRNMLEKVEPVD